MAIFWTAGVIVQALFGAATPISGDSIKSNNALDNFNATVNHSLAARARTQCDPKASSQKDWSGDWSFEKDGMNCNMNDGEWPYGDAHQCSSYNIAGDLVAADRSETITTEANGFVRYLVVGLAM
ncbi:hypothetical protein N7512_010404 [Penicillium capsulatum]|nr:hypothetical protein N7512_010404 [Penicillium capsulatum]